MMITYRLIKLEFLVNREETHVAVEVEHMNSGARASGVENYCIFLLLYIWGKANQR